MYGVTILSENTYRIGNIGESIASLLIGCLVGVLAIAFSCMTESKWFVAFISILVGSIISAGAVQSFKDCRMFYTDYKVTIDDSVGFNEFNSRYEVISQDGDIYTVREKESDNDVQVY